MLVLDLSHFHKTVFTDKLSSYGTPRSYSITHKTIYLVYTCQAACTMSFHNYDLYQMKPHNHMELIFTLKANEPCMLYVAIKKLTWCMRG